MSNPDMKLWLDSNRGINIPQNFVKSFIDFDKHVKNVSVEDKEILLEGPEHVSYWETWDDVESKARVIDENGYEYFLYHDGDLWLIPINFKWDEELGFFRENKVTKRYGGSYFKNKNWSMKHNNKISCNIYIKGFDNKNFIATYQLKKCENIDPVRSKSIISFLMKKGYDAFAVMTINGEEI